MHVALALPTAAQSSVRLPRCGASRNGGIRVATPQPQTSFYQANRNYILFGPAATWEAPGMAVLEAEQYSLWRVHSGPSCSNHNFRLKPLGGAVREVVVEVDPRLRPLPARPPARHPAPRSSAAQHSRAHRVRRADCHRDQSSPGLVVARYIRPRPIRIPPPFTSAPIGSHATGPPFRSIPAWPSLVR